MCNILTTADCRAKRTNIWDSGYYSVYVQDTFDAWFLEFGLESFGALCKIFNFTIFVKLCSSHNFHPVYPNFNTRYHNHTGCHFFGDLPKNCKSYGTLKFFSTQDYMQLEFSKCHYSHNFHWSPSKLYDSIRQFKQSVKTPGTLVTKVNLVKLHLQLIEESLYVKCMYICINATN